MKMIKFTNGLGYFWVKDKKKIKWWRGLIGLGQSRVEEIKEIEI